MALKTREAERLALRLPPEEKAYIAAQAIENMTSMNAEIVRSIRFRRESESQAAG
jgi:Arc-like DNA binding domain